jgi:hypothetical protein
MQIPDLIDQVVDRHGRHADQVQLVQMADIERRQYHAAISESTTVRYLKDMNFTFKRYRYRLKKTEPGGIRPRRQGDREAGPARS